MSAARRRNEATFISDVAVDAGKLMEAINATGYTCSDVKSSPYEKKGLFGLG